MKDQSKQKIKKYKQSKRKTLWTPELHQLFCQTIEQLYRAKIQVTPKYIVKLMNTELKRRKKECYQLTRTQVASHLQQYRQEVTDVLLKQALRDDSPSPAPGIKSETTATENSDESLPSFISASQPFEEECLLEDDTEPVQYNEEQLNTYLCMDTSTSPDTYVMYSGDNTLCDFLQSFGITTCNNTSGIPTQKPWFATDSLGSWVDCP